MKSETEHEVRDRDLLKPKEDKTAPAGVGQLTTFKMNAVGHWKTETDMQTTIEQILIMMCEPIWQISVYFQESGTSFYRCDDMSIHLHQTNDWKETYQLAYELLHHIFYMNQDGDRTDTTWVEEILCGAFSIFCLRHFERGAINEWYDYLCLDFYEKQHDIKKIPVFTSITSLNEALTGDKTYETLQVIHPTVLKILDVLDQDFSQLWAFKKYTPYMVDGRIIADAPNQIASVLYEFQQTINKGVENL